MRKGIRSFSPSIDRMQAYSKSLSGAATTLVLDPAWEFLKTLGVHQRTSRPSSETLDEELF
jgi:hypothetical protein